MARYKQAASWSYRSFCYWSALPTKVHGSRSFRRIRVLARWAKMRWGHGGDELLEWGSKTILHRTAPESIRN